MRAAPPMVNGLKKPVSSRLKKASHCYAETQRYNGGGF
jgi:hypothetical protein